MNLCDECGIRKARGMYAKDGKTKQYCMYCITKLYPDLAKVMTEYATKMNQQYQHAKEEHEEIQPIIDILPLVPKSKRFPVMQLVFCRTCNFFPLSHLPSMRNRKCKRCNDTLEILSCDMKAIPYNSYITSEIAN